ncbi:1-deoxy-D-xylulose-5-phosphate synthase [Clostridiaceae bacterium Marseille-Q4145]|jgi:1-deoxy-D-xylulose-5-phosphate synthase|nr:1-deoxy-D-xylulose-5-phosphate synthase [Clostridiaceae bacterium Marseille-Q4145]
MVLEKINQVNDIKKIPPEEYDTLAEEIRQFLITKISQTGGHLASNLGVVELTMALHLCFDFPKDKVVWDVGHQSYTHKLLTGRKAGFDELRKYGGMSGFPKRKESDCDSFDTGHSSTSISAGIGLVAARDLRGGDEHVISVIGDGALTGGMAYEALNNASRLKKNFIIILNDNNMSIAENVGGVSEYLNGLRTNEAYTNFKTGVEQSLNRIPGGTHLANQLKKTKSGIKQLFIPGMFFEDMGVTYLGPVDGHDIGKLQEVLKKAKKVKGAVLVHVLTKKGKGYLPAERHPSRFHGAEPFDIETGLPSKKRKKANYQDVFSTCMVKLGQRNKNVVAITAAMPDGTGLKRFKNIYPERFFDVGIAEEHAVTFAAGLAAGGMRPIFAVYSSFLQRAYDQVLHDVCIQNLPVVFAIDRAGLVGSDGETHQGIFDLSYLSSIPNMHIMAPKNKWELSDMLKFAVEFDGPIALRYPRGEAYDGLKDFRKPIEYGKSEFLYEEEDIAILAVGSMVKTAEEVRHKLKDMGYNCSLVNARFVKPIDTEIIKELSKEHRLLVTMEENVRSGGYGEKVRDFVEDHEIPVHLLTIALPDEYVEHGNVALLYEEVGIDAESVTKRIVSRYAACPKEDDRA